MGQMIEKSKLISGLLFIAVIIVAAAFIIDSLSLNTTSPSSPNNIPDDPIITEIESHKESLAHGALGDSTGCAQCHSEPITSGSCTSTECQSGRSYGEPATSSWQSDSFVPATEE